MAKEGIIIAEGENRVRKFNKMFQFGLRIGIECDIT